MIFPNQLVPESQKTLTWVKAHLTYANSILLQRQNIFTNLNRLYASYNGIKNHEALRYIEKTYGKANKAKLISYRIGRNKLQLICGEWLNSPLASTVETINSEARVKKLDQADLIKGAVVAKNELDKLKSAGVDVMEGMDVPQGDPDEIWNSMSFKDKNETVMQIIIDNCIRELELKHKLSKNFLDILIAGSCYGKIDIDSEGNINYLKIDPRDAIYDEIEGDDFIERSPLKGARYRMTLSEILSKYPQLDAKQKDQIKSLESTYRNTNQRPRGTSVIGGDLCIDVIHIEWLSYLPTYYKLSPKTQAQMEFDSSTDYIKIEFSDPKIYEDNKEYYDKLVEKGKLLGIETEWAEDIREAVMIGEQIVLDLGRKKFQTRRVDNPSRIVDMSYVGALFGTIDGIRIPLQQLVENFDSMFDVTMYQILKELNAAKGRVLGYNRAALPQDKKYKDIVYEITNDSFIDYDSSADGNQSGQELRLNDLIQTYDLGLSSSFQQLILLKNEIKRTLDEITGINENRQGDIAASSTAANAQQAIVASRTITEPLFYQMEMFTEKLLMKLAETYKVSYAYYKIEKGQQILGDSQQRFLQVEKEIGYQDYGVSLQSGRKYNDLKQKIIGLAEASLNAKEISLEDLAKVEMADSYAKALAALKVGRKTQQEYLANMQQQQAEQQQQMQQQQLQVQQQMALENREDTQKAKLDEINLKGEWALKVEQAKTHGKMATDANNAEQQSLNNNLDMMQ